MTDNRDRPRRQKIINKIQQLSKSYTPEWNFDLVKPDVGTAIGMVYADQTEETLAAMASIDERYHTEFVNFLDLSLLPAKPAKSVCLMDLISDTIPGTYVAKGTKLVASMLDREDVVFETEHNLYVTGSGITDVFMTGEESGRITPLKGKYKKPLYIEKEFDEYVEENDESIVNLPQLKPFKMFGEDKTIGEDAILFYHTSLFDVDEGEEIFVHVSNGDNLYKKIIDSKRKFYYYTEGEIKPVEGIRETEDESTIAIKIGRPFDKVTIDEVDYSLLILKSELPVDSVDVANGFEFASSGDEKPATFVTDGNIDLNAQNFIPFVGDLSLYSESYICCDDYFSKKGAKAKISFDLSYEERKLSITREEEDASLKIIKRKPKVIHMDVPVSVYAQEIALEYYNGVGWTKLECDSELEALFADGSAKEVEFTFTIPDDWEQTTEGAKEGRFLRVRLLKADNCYMRPAIHYMPRIKNLDISYSYEEQYVDADKIVRISGLEKKDITKEIKMSEEPYALFIPSEHHLDAIYIGLNRPIEEGPATLFFRLNEENPFNELKCRFEYSTPQGFSTMKVVDLTKSFTKSGILLFIPLPDMEKTEIGGRKNYWIRIVCTKKSMEKEDLPTLLSINTNAVTVSNIETSEDRDFYIDEPVPGMNVNLEERNILSADVWVNEKGNLSTEAMEIMEQEYPDRVRSSKNDAGIYTSFFVLWDEVTNFLTSKSRRVYILDRANRRILFGDGIRTDYPRVSSEVSFMVRLRRCVGSLGNVPENTITNTRTNIRFVGDITNPVRAYGGCDMETIPLALARGANMLHSRGRLISVGDYERAIKSYSELIDQVKCLVGSDVDQMLFDDMELVIVVLMKDYSYGSFSFHQIENELKDFLNERGELTIPENKICITEPVFVELSVDIWADILDIEESFELVPLVEQVLDEYLSPLGEDGEGGWGIGVFPRASQIQMRLAALKSRLIIKKISVSATYTDSEGTHIKDLSELEVMPYMVCKSGKHSVHIMH